MRVLAACVLIAGSVAAHFYAMEAGIYAEQMRHGIVWFDNVLHACVGFAFGLLWLSITRRLQFRMGFVTEAASLLVFVLAVAVGWEIFEYGFYLIFKSGALGLTVYEPSLQESVLDSLSNVGGALLLLAGIALFGRRAPIEPGE